MADEKRNMEQEELLSRSQELDADEKRNMEQEERRSQEADLAEPGIGFNAPKAPESHDWNDEDWDIDAVLDEILGHIDDIGSDPSEGTEESVPSSEEPPAEELPAPTVDAFGSAPKKKNRMPAVIAAVLAVVVLVGVGIFTVPRLLDRNDSTKLGEISGQTTSETADDLKSQIKEKTLVEAKTLADSGDYAAAIALIKNTQETQGDDADYQVALKTYSVAYMTEVIASADSLAANGDFVGAIALLESAQDVIGKNDDLANKITEINNSKPVYAELTSLKVIDSSYYYEQDESLILDTYGNAYTNVATFRECGTHHATYYTAGKYATLYGTIAAPDSIDGGDVAITVNIYADDKLIHTIPSITRMTKPVDIVLDITGADTVKIEAVTTNVYPTGILFKLNVSTGAASQTPNYTSSLNYGENENITDLKVIDSSYEYSAEDAAIMDTYGNTYVEAGTFRECGTHYAIYYTARKYTSLKGTIAAPDSIGSDGVAITVNIYADDKLIYTLPSITRTTKPVDIDLDITDADTVKIEAVTTNVYPTGILFKLDVS